jgi:hypothetical protein
VNPQISKFFSLQYPCLKFSDSKSCDLNNKICEDGDFGTFLRWLSLRFGFPFRAALSVVIQMCGFAIGGMAHQKEICEFAVCRFAKQFVDVRLVS